MPRRHAMLLGFLLTHALSFAQGKDSTQTEPLMVNFPEVGWEVELPPGYVKAEISGTAEEREYQKNGTLRYLLARKYPNGFLWVTLRKSECSSASQYDSLLNGASARMYDAAASMPNMMTDFIESKDSVGGFLFRKFTFVMHEKAAPWMAGKLIKKESMVACWRNGYEIFVQYDYLNDATGQELMSCFRRSRFKD